MTVRFDPTKEVPSLELCERLKKLGFPQDRDWLVWVKYEDLPQDKDSGGNILAKDRGYILAFGWEIPFDIEIIKAPTVRELGEWLPISIKEGKSFLDIDRPSPNTWIVGYTESHSWRVNAVAYDGDTEANARAKMIIWLVENGYVKFGGKAMNIHDYLRGCLKTWSGNWRDFRAVLGLVGEAGEVAEKYKKYLRGDYENGIETAMTLHGKQIDEQTQMKIVGLAYNAFKETIKKELGDVIYYWAVLCYELGLDPAEVMEDNLKKLADRQARGKIKGSGDER